MKILDKLGLNDQQPTPRKIALLVGVVVLFILVLWFFSRSWVIINVENSSGEVIISVEKDGEETNRINGSFAFLPLNSGEYTISAKDKSGSTAKYAKLRSGDFGR